MELVKGGETVANTIHLEGKFQLDKRYDVLDVVTNGVDSYCCVRANSGADVTDTQYWMLLAKGRDGKDAQPPKLEINDQGYFVINGQVTNKKAQGPSGDMATTQVMTNETDLNSMVNNGFYVKTEGKISHGPTGVSKLTLLVYGNQSAITQLLHSVTDNSVYIRSRIDGNWTDWRQITQWN